MSDARASEPSIGDYVLATKWRDGDPRDHWVVGFYCGADDSVPNVAARHLVCDGGGDLFRRNGFRRVKKISSRRGKYILENKNLVQGGARSLWWWARVKMQPGEIDSELL